MSGFAAVSGPGSEPAVAPLAVRWSRFTARHPEWWVAAVAALAWAALVAPGPAAGHHAHHAHHGHAHAASAGPSGGLEAWMLMTLAMMLPVLLPRVRHVAASSLRRIRGRAVAETLAGFMLVWLVVGVLVVTLLPSTDAAASPGVFAACWIVVAVWHTTIFNHRGLTACHAVRVPAAAGQRRERLVAGSAYALWCVVSCGPAMVAMAVTGHPLLVMAVLTVGLVAERVAHRPRTASRYLAAVLPAAALVTVLSAGA